MSHDSDQSVYLDTVEPELVAELAGEAAGLMLFAVRDRDTWLFWGEASRYEAGRGWLKTTSQPSEDLLRLLPQNWSSLYPVRIHPEFRGWFQSLYQAADAKADAWGRPHHQEWMRCLHVGD